MEALLVGPAGGGGDSVEVGYGQLHHLFHAGRQGGGGTGLGKESRHVVFDNLGNAAYAAGNDRNTGGPGFGDDACGSLGGHRRDNQKIEACQCGRDIACPSGKTDRKTLGLVENPAVVGGNVAVRKQRLTDD